MSLLHISFSLLRYCYIIFYINKCFKREQNQIWTLFINKHSFNCNSISIVRRNIWIRQIFSHSCILSRNVKNWLILITLKLYLLENSSFSPSLLLHIIRLPLKRWDYRAAQKLPRTIQKFPIEKNNCIHCFIDCSWEKNLQFALSINESWNWFK